LRLLEKEEAFFDLSWFGHDLRYSDGMELIPWPRIRMAAFWRIPAGKCAAYQIECHHLLLIAHGSLEVENLGRTVQAGAGDLLCLAPTTRNVLRIAQTVTYNELYVFFESPADWARRGVEEQQLFLPLHTSLRDHHEVVRALFEKICLRLERANAVDRFQCQAHLLEILALLHGCRREVGAETLKGHPDDWARVKALLEGRVTDAPPISEIAKGFGISAEHFVRQFKKRFGMPPKAYRQYSRVLWAADLLVTTSDSIKAIAYRSGFPSPQALTRAFQSWLRISPSEYRENGGRVSPSKVAVLPLEGALRLNRHVSPPDAGDQPVPIQHW